MAAAEPISPELVLVSPELRERALATLPSLDAEALFVVAPRPAPAVAAARPAPSLLAPGAAPAVAASRAAPAVAAPPREPPGSLPLAFAAYVAEAVFLGTVRGATMFAAIAVAAFLLAR